MSGWVLDWKNARWWNNCILWWSIGYPVDGDSPQENDLISCALVSISYPAVTVSITCVVLLQNTYPVVVCFVWFNRSGSCVRRVHMWYRALGGPEVRTPGGCFTKVWRALQNILVKFVCCRNCTSYELYIWPLHFDSLPPPHPLLQVSGKFVLFRPLYLGKNEENVIFQPLFFIKIWQNV